jgi:competence protein ComEA
MAPQAVAQPSPRARAGSEHGGAHAGGGHTVAPATCESEPRARFPFFAGTLTALSKLRTSVWAPLVLRVAVGGALALGLAAVGTASLEHLPSGSALQAGALAERGLGWLAAGPAAPSSEPHRPHTATSAAPAPDGAAKAPPAASAAAPAPCPSTDAAKPAENGVTADGKVILNTATENELIRLPGIGQRRAEAIIELRERLKRFKKPTDLLRVRGIGIRGLKRMLPMLVVDPPAPPAPPSGEQAPNTQKRNDAKAPAAPGTS